jgi:uncharacterized coiled-coil protein SlyX
MSPHAVNSFVNDLVQMAQAMERVPSLEHDLAMANRAIEDLTKAMADRIADIEQARQRNGELEQKLHDAEVARDDAELRFLELDEKANAVVKALQGVQATLGVHILSLDPAKPEPTPEPEVKPIIDPLQTATTASVFADNGIGINETKGQSEPLPTAEPVSIASPNASSETVFKQDDASSGPSPKPVGRYAGKRYANHPFYVSLSQWLAEDGTEEDYLWRPEPAQKPIW